MEAGGTWMGVTRDGKFATVTNIPSPYRRSMKAKNSRGKSIEVAVIAKLNIRES